MELMNNQYIILEDITTTLGTLKNTTRVNLLPKIPSKFFTDGFINYLKLEDDSLLEAISFRLYKNTNYWDILMALNGIKNLNELPVNYDRVLDRIDTKMQSWLDKGRLLYSTLNKEEIDTKYEEIKENEIEQNEKYRNLKYISPDDLSTLLAELNILTKKHNIDENIIISKDK